MRFDSPRAELATVREAGRQSEQRAAVQAELTAAEAKRAAAAEGIAAVAHAAEQVARGAAGVLRQELDAIVDKRGWRSLLLRMTGIVPRSKPMSPPR